MTKPKLFQLKAEVAQAPSGPIAIVLPYARIQVDTGVFHLDQLYDYQIPEKLSALVQSGVRVQVPFGNRETEGIVVERIGKPERAGELKHITKVLSSLSVTTKSSLDLIQTVAQHYACNPWDVIRSAIPPRVASVEKGLVHHQFEVPSLVTSVIEFHTFRPFVQAHVQTAQLALLHQSKGSVLIVAPDEKDVDLISQALTDSGIIPLKLTASMPRADRYRNFLHSMNGSHLIVVGTRSAIFAPVSDLATVIVHKESAHDHYEVRSPGWNTRMVAIMRARNEKVQLFLTGFSPSLEVSQNIDKGVMRYVSKKDNVSVKAFTPSEGALLPGRIFSDIKKALMMGPVLFIAPRKGYGNALLCSNCRNTALCDCGGRLAVNAKGIAPACVHCGKAFPSWKCALCNRDKQYLAARGIERASEEISRAFPNFPVTISAGEVIKNQIEAKPGLVLATPGAIPQVDGGYSAVVVLDGLRFFSHTDLRSQERARELFAEAASLISPRGSILMVIDDSHPIVAAVARWNIAPLLKRELSQCFELELPPSVSSCVLVMEQEISAQVATGLRKALSQDRLPSSTRIYGPTEISKGQAKIVLHVATSAQQSLTDVVHELQRRRSIAKKELFTLRVDPYSL